MGAQLEPETVLKVFYQACQAVKHLHSQSMPITHRDIKVTFDRSHKVKNLLLNVVIFRLRTFCWEPMD